MAQKNPSDQSREQLMAHGESVYLKNCVGCHQINGAGVAGLIPALTGSAIATGKWESLDGFLRAGTAKMQNFLSGGAITDFAKSASGGYIRAVRTMNLAP